MSGVRGASLTSLLYGPSKAVFSSALLGTAASLVLIPGQPAHCSSFYQIPYDDDVWQAEHSFHKDTLSLPADVAKAAPVAKVPKAKRPVGWQALGRIAGPKNVLLTLVRNEALSCVFVLHGYFEALSAEEDLAELEDREPKHVPFPDVEMRVAASRGFFNACIDWATQFVRSLLDWAASRTLSADLAGKLVKDLRASVKRKGRYAFYYRGIRVVKTSVHSEATLYLADFLVAASLECYKALRGYRGPLKPPLRRLGLRCAMQGARCGTMLMTASVANGVGSMSPFRSSFAMFLLVQLSGFVVNGYFFSLIEHLTGGGPSMPPLPPAAAADAAAEARTAAAASHTVVAEPLMFANDQVPEGTAGVVAEVVLQAGAAMAAGAAAQAAAGRQGDEPQQEEPERRAAAAAHDVGVQADEPPEPVPQQRRRVMGGPRLPDRPVRHQAGVIAPPPQAPHTPQFREPRGPSPAPDSEDAELAVAAGVAAGAANATPAAASMSANDSSEDTATEAAATAVGVAEAIEGAPAAVEDQEAAASGEPIVAATEGEEGWLSVAAAREEDAPAVRQAVGDAATVQETTSQAVGSSEVEASEATAVAAPMAAAESETGPSEASTVAASAAQMDALHRVAELDGVAVLGEL